MSNIKLKNRIMHVDDPKSIFNNTNNEEYKYVIMSKQSGVIIFFKNKRFFKDRKSDIKKLIISDDEYKNYLKEQEDAKTINALIDKSLQETIRNINNENNELKEKYNDLCDSITDSRKLSRCTVNIDQFYINMENFSFLSNLEPGSYFFQQLDEITKESGSINVVKVFKIPDDKKATIYNTVCKGSLIFRYDSENSRIKLIDYSMHRYGDSYLKIAKEEWGFTHSFMVLLKERQLMPINGITIQTINESIYLYDSSSKNISINSIVGMYRVRDFLNEVANNIM